MRRRSQAKASKMAVSQDEPTDLSGKRRPLEERVSFLAHRINARLLHVCNPLIADYKLDLFSSRIIVAIAERGPMRVGDIVELMALPQSTISHQLKRLERDQYIRRTRSETDNRTVVITLTPQGQEMAEICNRLSDLIMANISQALSKQEIEHLSDLMKRVFDSLPEQAVLDQWPDDERHS